MSSEIWCHIYSDKNCLSPNWYNKEKKNHHLYFTYLRRNLNYLDATNSIFVRELNTQGASKTSLLAQATKKKSKSRCNFFFFFVGKKKTRENLIGCEMSGFSDPAVPWLRLRRAEIKAAFRAPSLPPSQGEEVLSGKGSVLQQCWWKESMELFFKAMCFYEARG